MWIGQERVENLGVLVCVFAYKCLVSLAMLTHLSSSSTIFPRKTSVLGALGLFCILAHISCSCVQIIARLFFEHLFSYIYSVNLQMIEATFWRNSPRLKGSSHSVLKNWLWTGKQLMSKLTSVLNTCQSVSYFIPTTYTQRKTLSPILCIYKYAVILKT